MDINRKCATRTLGLILASLLSNPMAAQQPAKKQQPRFDYYLLSLSWSPQHCATSGDHSPQCTGPRPYGFVVHGLWPNASNGRHPQNCAGPRLDASRISKDVLEIMPSRDLVKHEWEKHGRCSGMGQDAYFEKVLAAWAKVVIPEEFRSPRHQVTITPAALRRRFSEANPAFVQGSFAVTTDGRYLREVRTCMTKEFQSRSCPNPGDTSNRSVIMRPVR